MRLLIALAALSTLGCSAWNALLLAGQVVEAAGEAGQALRRASAPPPAHPEAPNEETRLTALRDRSRARLWPAAGPACAVRIVRSGPRTWRLISCDAELHCWACGETYDCEPVSSSASQPL